MSEEGEDPGVLAWPTADQPDRQGITKPVYLLKPWLAGRPEHQRPNQGTQADFGVRLVSRNFRQLNAGDDLNPHTTILSPGPVEQMTA